MNKIIIAILFCIIIIVSYLLKSLNSYSKDNMEVSNEEKSNEDKIIESEVITENGWWDNVINCKLNGDNSLFCKGKEKWIFPY
jgi:hypothetical protein